MTLTVSPAQLRVLACPDCKGPLHQEDEHLRCVACNQNFPIKNQVIELLGKKEQSNGGK